MSQIRLQDLAVNINPTSRYGSPYDTVQVNTLLVTSQPIPQDKSWYVPSGVTVPPYVEEMLKAKDIPMYPQSAEKLLAGTEDIQKVAQQGNLEGTIDDAAKLLMLSIMKKVSLAPVPGTNNMYALSYEYKLYSKTEGGRRVFDFLVQLPFDGLQMIAGSRVHLTAVMPYTAKVDQAFTKGTDANGREIREQIVALNNGRQAVSFVYQNDPEFIIRYTY